MSDGGVQTELEILPEEKCVRLLHAGRIGRLAFSDQDQPVILPVNYTSDERAIVFRTAPGTKLERAPMTKVVFEIDEVDATTGVAWSVLAKGVAYEITAAADHLSERLRKLIVEPMAPGERERWPAVVWHDISDRRFRLPSAP